MRTIIFRLFIGFFVWGTTIVYAYCWYIAYMFYDLKLTFFSILSKGLSIFLLLIWIVLVYISVVLGELCPSIFCKYLKFTLFSIQCVANECRKVCTVAQGLEFVSATAFLKIARTLVVLYFPPVCPLNNQYDGFSFLK